MTDPFDTRRPERQSAQPTIAEHLVDRLVAAGARHVFGVPGDYNLRFLDVIEAHPELEWVGNANELDAAYAADGYARIRGVGAVTTTYGVGELSALNGIAGAYAEHLPVFHLVGMPTIAAQTSRALVHHTLGTGEFDVFAKMAEPVVCASAIMTPQNVAHETERLIAAALYHRRPVYVAFPSDVANQSVVSSAQPVAQPRSDPAVLRSASEAVLAAITAAQNACILPGLVAARAGLGAELQAFASAILSGKQPAVTGEEGVAGLEIAIQCLQKKATPSATSAWQMPRLVTG